MKKTQDKELFKLKGTGHVAKAATEKADSHRRTVARMLLAIDSGCGKTQGYDSNLSGKEVAEGLLEMKDWEESQHPRGKGGKFVKKGSGGSSSGSSSSSSSKGPETYQLIKPSKIEYPYRAPSGSSMSEIIRAGRITRLGEESKKKRVAGATSGDRFVGKKDFPETSVFGKKKPEGKPSKSNPVGVPTKNLPNGSGETRTSVGDLYDPNDPNTKNTLVQYVDDNGNLTPEREALHQQAVDDLFVGHKPKAEGEPKVFTMLGGGSASGKGALTRPGEADYFGTPDKTQSVTIDPDELKKVLPEYREEQETDMRNAAANAHEESSILKKRAIEAAIANGYDFTLDGTGDGKVSKVIAQIEQAREAGYQVNGCYVTCPTELAVSRSIERAEREHRFVPLDTLRQIHRDVSIVFPQVAPLFDHVRLYDTNQPKGQKPKLIAECRRGQEIDIKDQKAWEAFIAKGEE